MANLPETSNFDAGVYQIETTDDAIGGVDGIDNKQGINLGNRTRWLYDHSLIDDTNPIGNYSVGAIFYAVGTKLLSLLGIGAVNKVLVSTGTAPSWSDTLSMVYMRVSRAFSVRGLAHDFACFMSVPASGTQTFDIPLASAAQGVMIEFAMCGYWSAGAFSSKTMTFAAYLTANAFSVNNSTAGTSVGPAVADMTAALTALGSGNTVRITVTNANTGSTLTGAVRIRVLTPSAADLAPTF